MSIEISNETSIATDLDEVRKLARHVLDSLWVHPEAEVGITLVDEEASSRLHVEWMDLEGATDVMSFPMDELTPGTPGKPSSAGMLGDIVICPMVAQDQAKAGGHSYLDEVLLLTTHGLLHLLGFDHDEPDDREEMFSLQRELLEKFLGRPAPKETIQ
ncbi:rRNA maturation RNase YbeY [Neomicrococcus aestuarii]|uniref:Endoribonuclease YbeY n=1 Tax=Neomicrococcus aestuarii TaxID=556325 RepID=A0A1L2ZM44_9MICC|nr:rRNA maturation RNase YbeY [Neomicrococcus aestuarii]APF40091.1 rRNA maturation RNase YbeY [Neomicrococcus aestuarii]MBB5511940.1 putative rRNA maturation factor [Neomicrococcus aestuarii]